MVLSAHEFAVEVTGNGGRQAHWSYFQNLLETAGWNVMQPCCISNFSLIAGETRNIYKIKKIYPVLSKFKPFQNHLHSLQIYPSQLFNCKTAVHDNKSLHFNSPGFPKCLSSSFLLLSIRNTFILPSLYLKNTTLPQAGADISQGRRVG